MLPCYINKIYMNMCLYNVSVLMNLYFFVKRFLYFLDWWSGSCCRPCFSRCGSRTRRRRPWWSPSSMRSSKNWRKIPRAHQLRIQRFRKHFIRVRITKEHKWERKIYLKDLPFKVVSSRYLATMHMSIYQLWRTSIFK